MSPDLHSQQTTSSLLSLLLAPITSYISPLTLLAIPSYAPLLSAQPYSTRLAIGQAIVSSVLKNNTLIEGNLGGGPPIRQRVREGPEMRELAEEQGWVARMVHLFRNEDLGVQYEVSRVDARGCVGAATNAKSCCKPLANTLPRAAIGYDSPSHR
jgi:vacuolar protein sorting-associated protein 35